MTGSAARYLLLAVTSLSLMSLAACETASTDARDSGEMLFFPVPPDSPRIQYLTYVAGEEELDPEEESSFARFVLGEDQEAKPRVRKPFGVAARDGVLYVCDTEGNYVCRLDFNARKFSIFGATGQGRLLKPVNIVVDQLGYKFVADAVRNEVVVFGPDDTFIRALKIPGDPCRVVDVALHGNELFVLNNLGTKILVLDRSSGEVLRSFGERGTAPGQFALPSGIAVSPDGFLYVCDPIDRRIQKLTLDGQSVWSRGGPGFSLGKFGRPRGIEVGPDGTIYITDANTAIVQMWRDDGQVLMHFGGPGTRTGQLYLPSCLAVDATVVDFFKQYLHPEFQADYLLLVASQYGPRKVSVYAFGSFPEGYDLSGTEFKTIEPIPATEEETGAFEEGAPTEGNIPPVPPAPAPDGSGGRD